MEQETCAWALKHPLEQAYHDAEWGVPVYDDNTLFEFITLEGAQAGLSWITILKKREGYRQAFEEYDLTKLGRYSAEQVEARTEEIITQFDVVKHRGKIRSVFSNAQAALRLVEEYGSLSNALWQFVEHKPIINHWQTMSEVPTSSAESKAMSQFLKKRGFKFVGETICYAFLQATGMVDDHLQTCPKKAHL
ncbi:DNA-3-methyladenine glycosylase I [Vibrio scophthalmi]|uniref:DNA-3-methyladenine glycosylase I n=1 Tax=Vibrio scophthalmi TaxID=45658 RepID=UPI002284F64F|nr:DNA-3-methyladenine glycosylase I [Vibrio scophthalmi]MCY9803231.1 DNA-3-methyladenine glycosylase I [Vibrio scophthalmi]